LLRCSDDEGAGSQADPALCINPEYLTPAWVEAADYPEWKAAKEHANFGGLAL
jgi:hypothetical protein